MKRCVAIVLLVCLTGTYVSGQKYQPPKEQVPTTYRGDSATQPDPQTLANLKWFDVFKDQKLQDLINEALTHNYDLREAVTRIEAARANVGITRSDQFPTIGAGADVLNQRQSR